MTRGLRVLQIIGDTDRLPAHLAAVELHQGLAAAGLELRTLALAPGRTGGLEDVVPAIAHARRSVAARSQLVQERRWADVVVLHGPRVLTPSAVPGRSDPAWTVLALWGPPPAATPRRWRSDVRLARRCRFLVVDDPGLVRPVADRYGRRDAVVALMSMPGSEPPAVDVAGWVRLIGSGSA